MGGTTRTAEALLYAQHEFDKKFGGRASKAEKFLILFTDGYSQVNCFIINNITFCIYTKFIQKICLSFFLFVVF